MVPLLGSCAGPFEVFMSPRTGTSQDLTTPVWDSTQQGSSYPPTSTPYSSVSPGPYPYTPPIQNPYTPPTQSEGSSASQRKALTKQPRLVPVTAPESVPESEQRVVQIDSKSNLAHKPIRLVPLTGQRSERYPDYPPPVGRGSPYSPYGYRYPDGYQDYPYSSPDLGPEDSPDPSAGYPEWGSSTWPQPNFVPYH